jgi:cytochrome c-type biogenesis protein CcmH
LEGRLFSKGGSVEEWLKLMNALGVLGQPDRGKTALAAAEKALAADPAALEQVRAAATAAGFAP